MFSQTDFYEELRTPETPDTYSSPYDFAPDADSPDVEVAPLEVNDKDQDVPYPQGMPDRQNVPEQLIPTGGIQPAEQ